nr:RNA-directed DNA polymerase, eukaryota, reverse transcriptase zinc-binding domain protein [Tanacetum cinerariifolium]
VCNKGIFKGLSLADDGSNISLLQYADDALFFGDWFVLYARHLVRILDCFHDVSGLKIYLSKSMLFGIGIPIDDVLVWLELLIALMIPFRLRKWAWRRQPSGRTLTDLSSLNLLITRLVLDSTIEDKWTWALEDSGKFSVRSLCKGIHSNLFVSQANSPSFRWNSWVSRKRLRFLNEKDALWSSKIYGSDGGFDAWRGSRQESKRWSKIDDVWQGKWAWRRQPSGRTLTDLSSLNLLITGLVLDSAIEDKWTWALEDSGGTLWCLERFTKDEGASRDFHGVCLTAL